MNNMVGFASDVAHRPAMVRGDVFKITCPVCPIPAQADAPAEKAPDAPAEEAPVMDGFSVEFAVKTVFESLDDASEAGASKFIDAVIIAKMHNVIQNNDRTVVALRRVALFASSSSEDEEE
ncbi:hypothetical protein CYMTET_46603 [Cymbomonas tetramitiformis]|uniref:Uncharacterized protein n=1 Tax=Cymbomonas tetramitiformis TaxID=36881 RepID=A0AAE0BX25_9CHLO|nr:hypothetical protein CYMTET_46603 [Cymbomonas tetramitiformis]